MKKKFVGDRREQIIEVATALFAQHGMVTVTTRQIARAVGISQPSLYAHFPSVDAIAGEICARGFREMGRMLHEALAFPGTPLERLDRNNRAYVDYALANPHVYRIACMNEVDREKYPGPNQGMEAGVEAFLIMHGLVAEIFDHDEERTMLVAQSVWATTHGLVSLLIARDYFPWMDRELLISTHLRSLREGVAALARNWPGDLSA